MKILGQALHSLTVGLLVLSVTSLSESAAQEVAHGAPTTLVRVTKNMTFGGFQRLLDRATRSAKGPVVVSIAASAQVQNTAAECPVVVGTDGVTIQGAGPNHLAFLNSATSYPFECPRSAGTHPASALVILGSGNRVSNLAVKVVGAGASALAFRNEHYSAFGNEISDANLYVEGESGTAILVGSPAPLPAGIRAQVERISNVTIFGSASLGNNFGITVGYSGEVQNIEGVSMRLRAGEGISVYPEDPEIAESAGKISQVKDVRIGILAHGAGISSAGVIRSIDSIDISGDSIDGLLMYRSASAELAAQVKVRNLKVKCYAGGGQPVGIFGFLMDLQGVSIDCQDTTVWLASVDPRSRVLELESLAPSSRLRLEGRWSTVDSVALKQGEAFVSDATVGDLHRLAAERLEIEASAVETISDLTLTKARPGLYEQPELLFLFDAVVGSLDGFSLASNQPFVGWGVDIARKSYIGAVTHGRIALRPSDQFSNPQCLYSNPAWEPVNNPAIGEVRDLLCVLPKQIFGSTTQE